MCLTCEYYKREIPKNMKCIYMQYLRDVVWEHRCVSLVSKSSCNGIPSQFRYPPDPV